jgi:catechol 2,3-dioxygenase-like lactoylglutathione lyase family enzyme
MKTRCFDHIDLRVKNMEVARKFYRKFLPQLGFVHERAEPAPVTASSDQVGGDFHTFYSAGGDRPSEFFGFTEDKNHQPNGTRIAALEGPEICVDYSPGYYAFFFEDLDGNKLEICRRESPIIAQ